MVMVPDAEAVHIPGEKAPEALGRNIGGHI